MTKKTKSKKITTKTSAPLFPSLLPTKTSSAQKTRFAGVEIPTHPRSTHSKSTHSQVKHSPIDYYNCLMNYAQQGFYDAEGKKQKIHACCKKCKLQAPTLNNQREKELVKLITSYKQVGDSLAKLLHPIK